MSQLKLLQPYDEYNQTLESNVHPKDWVNPRPSGRYNLVVVGAGTAGLVTAAGAAGLGAKVALVEKNLLGGDCLNVGCVPSKAIISSGRVAATVRDAHQFGVRVPEGTTVDFAKTMARMRELRAGISPHDSAARFRDLGVDVFIGDGQFIDQQTVRVGGQDLKFKKAVICTGARAADLPIPGFRETGCLTNETVFSLTELPKRLIVIGGGPIGCEMAQCFARFGSAVTLVEKSGAILSREEPDASRIVQDSLASDGVRFELHTEIVRMERRGEQRVVVIRRGGETSELCGDQILVGIGRSPNVEGLGLETVGVRYDKRNGIEVDDRLRTSNARVYAAGDVASKYKFTHAADFMARIVIQNALFSGRAKASQLIIPWATFTSPELAHVGIYPREARSSGIEIDSYTQPLDGVDRAILEGETNGFVRVHVKKGTDKILGATVVANNAGDIIGELTLAMKNGIGLKKVASTIHPYPTQADAIRKIGDVYSRTRLTPTVQTLFKKWLQWTR